MRRSFDAVRQTEGILAHTSELTRHRCPEDENESRQRFVVLPNPDGRPASLLCRAARPTGHLPYRW